MFVNTKLNACGGLLKLLSSECPNGKQNCTKTITSMNIPKKVESFFWRYFRTILMSWKRESSLILEGMQLSTWTVLISKKNGSNSENFVLLRYRRHNRAESNLDSIRWSAKASAFPLQKLLQPESQRIVFLWFKILVGGTRVFLKNVCSDNPAAKQFWTK